MIVVSFVILSGADKPALTASAEAIDTTSPLFTKVKGHLLKSYTLTSEEALAADVVNDGAVDLLDLLTLKTAPSVPIVPDTSWYTDHESDTEYILYNAAQLYGFSQVSQSNNFSGKTVKLGGNILVNVGVASTWDETAPDHVWTPIGQFAGTFNGQGYTISGLYVKNAAANTGFFSDATATSTIKNLRLENSYFESTMASGLAFLGSVAGLTAGNIDTVYSSATVVCGAAMESGGITGRMYATGASGIKNCWFDGSVTTDGQYSGGIVGRIAMGTKTLQNCLNTGTVTSNYAVTDAVAWVGGLCGAIQNGGADPTVTISDCLNVGKVTVRLAGGAGSVLGRNRNTVTFTNVYSTNDITNTNGTVDNTTNTVPGVGNHSTNNATVNGAPVIVAKATLFGYGGYQWTQLDFTGYWAAIDGAVPELKSFGKGTPLTDFTGRVRADTSWYTTNTSPYTLTTAEQLLGFSLLSQTVNFAGKTVNLGANITVNSGDVASWGDGTLNKVAWLPIGTISVAFAGTFNGQGHTVSGVCLKTGTAGAGFFGNANGSISNLRLENSYFESTMASGIAYLGSIAGIASGNVDTVYSNAAVVCGAATESGGLVGRVTGTGTSGITNSWFDGSVTTDGQYSGGIVGRIPMGTKTLENCLNTGTVTSNTTTGDLAYAGGLCGAIQSIDATNLPTVTINDSLNVGKVTVSVANAAGSVLGRNRHTVSFTDVYSTNDITNINGTVDNTTNTVPGVGNHSTNGATVTGAPAIVAEAAILGNDAATALTGLDFISKWQMVSNGTPILKSFAN
jgi:hypothetical protein